MELASLLVPATTAVVTVEMQRGIVGELAGGGPLVEVVANRQVIPAAQRLVTAARAAGVRVVHATVALRGDRAGVVVNNKVMAMAVKNPNQVRAGTPHAELIPELGPEPEDIVCGRIHGLTPFTGTELDAILRNLGVRTIVPVGVSVNEALLGTCLTAADLGYRIVLPTDAIAGVPEGYADSVVQHTLALISNPCSAADVIGAWSHAAGLPPSGDRASGDRGGEP
jgi:biuret amidohydrolase